MKIKIYSPVDATIKPITDCSDEIFAAKTLGDGIVIIPKKDNFKSPFEKAKVEMIFDTKHAIYFDVKGIKALMHVGLDTVKLNGEPFKIKTEEGKSVDLNTDIMSVDFKAIKEAKLSNETPIVFEGDVSKEIKVTILKKEAKQGEVVAEILINDISVEEAKQDPYEIESFKNKYRQVAEEIYPNLGGVNNFSGVRTCMTRFRVNIADKSKVNLDKLKSIPIVKAVQYAGDELQLIIGGEVVKVFDEFVDYARTPNKVKEQIVKKSESSIGKRMLKVVMGVMGPNLPLIMAAGLLTGIYTILEQTGAIPPGVGMTNLYDYNIFVGLMYVSCKVLFSLLGVLFLFNTVRYFNGNVIFAIAIGLILVSRAFYPVTPMGPEHSWSIPQVPGMEDNYLNFGFGDWITDPQGSGKTGFLLFRIGDYPIVIGGYEGSILHFAFAGFLIIVLDKWIKTWMPSVVDIILRPLLVIVMVLLGTWFIGGPIMSLVEYGVLEAFTYIGQIPYGIGLAIFSFFLPVLILFGVHSPLLTALAIPLIMGQGDTTGLILGNGINAFSNLGAAIGVGLITKNYSLKKLSLTAASSGIFGITEPIMYGVTVPKVRPFFMVMCTNAIISLILGNLNVRADFMTAPGVFGILAFAEFREQLIIILVNWVGGVSLACVLVMLFYKERSNELTLAKKGINRLVDFISFKDENIEKPEIKKELENLFASNIQAVHDLKEDYIAMAKHASLSSKYKEKLSSLEEKENKTKIEMYEKLLALKEKAVSKLDDENLQNKFFDFKKKYDNYNLNDAKAEVEQKIDELGKKYDQKILKLKTAREKNISDHNKLLDNIAQKYDIENIDAYKENFWNAMHSVEIGFNLIEKKPAKISDNTLSLNVKQNLNHMFSFVKFKDKKNIAQK